MDVTHTPMSLPDFSSPPVIETVIGVEFSPLKNWGAQHLGLFWSKIREEFPQFETQPPLASSAEGNGEGAEIATSVIFKLLRKSPNLRGWYVNESETTLIQVQNDRFILNWRKVTGDHEYPRYENTIRPMFWEYWDRFRAFLKAEGLGPPKVRLCEVSYVNHFLEGREWDSLEDLASIFDNWPAPLPFQSAAALTGVSATLSYEYPESRSRLAVQLESGKRRETDRRLLQLKLISRGAPESQDDPALEKQLDLGRHLVVNTFVEITSSQMHKLWGRKESE